MILADTSIWIEFLKAKFVHFQLMAGLIEERRIFALECIFGELLQGARAKSEKEVLLNYWLDLPKIDEQNIWIEAGVLSCDGKWFAKGVGLIDLAIVAAARKNDLKVWTLDKKLLTVLHHSEIFG